MLVSVAETVYEPLDTSSTTSEKLSQLHKFYMRHFWRQTFEVPPPGNIVLSVPCEITQLGL